MPHNIYLHSALVLTRKVERSDNEHKRVALKYFGLETALSLGVRGARSRASPARCGPARAARRLSPGPAAGGVQGFRFAGGVLGGARGCAPHAAQYPALSWGRVQVICPPFCARLTRRA
jgi:hypothetical protein